MLPVVVPEELYTHEDEGDQELVRVLPHVLPQIAEKEFLSEEHVTMVPFSCIHLRLYGTEKELSLL